MLKPGAVFGLGVVCALLTMVPVCTWAQDAPLPAGVKAVWDMSKAWRETTPTRESLCVNGLWRWQPVAVRNEEVPQDNWGYFKVPGPWPGTKWSRKNESQTAYPHASWKDVKLSEVQYAWYQREIVVPKEWDGRRVVVNAQYVHQSAVVFVDGERAGRIKSRGGEVEITDLVQPGKTQLLSILVIKPRGGRDFRGLCGDVYLEGMPKTEHVDNVKIETSVRKWQISAETAIAGLEAGKQYTLRGEILDDGKVVKIINREVFRAADLRDGRIRFSNPWHPDKLWDAHTPQNQYDLKLSLLTDGEVLDEFRSVRFGFREFWVDGKDLRLNGSRFFSFATRLDGGEVSAYASSTEGARKMFRRFRAIGVNTAYTHNYSCVVGAHMSFEEILKAADDTGMLVCLSQPRFPDYSWDAPDASRTNGYAEDAEFYVRQAQNHPSVVMYATSHNSTAYTADQNPDWIDGIHNPYSDPDGKVMRTDRRGRLATKAEEIIERLDGTRPIYHHSSGNLNRFYTLNCYLDFVPIQERSDWFEHWSTKGIKPLFLVEYGAPLLFNWSNSRSESNRRQTFYVSAEWGAQFHGDDAYRFARDEGVLPTKRLPSSENIAGVQAMFIAENWPAFRTLGISMMDNFDLHYTVFTARRDAKNPTLPVDWEAIQKPGFSPDFVSTRRWDIGYEDEDWTPNREGEAMMRYNRPLLATIAGKPGQFTSQDHNFAPGETVAKQAIVINNSRQKVTCDVSWSLDADETIQRADEVTVETGEQMRVPMEFVLARNAKPGSHDLLMTAKFSTGEVQKDVFAINVLEASGKPTVRGRVALLDPKGETGTLLSQMGVTYRRVDAGANLAGFDVFIIGKHALTLAEPKLNLSRVRNGLKVILFEQTNEVLEQRLGLRTQEYCLRRVFPRVPGHPILAGLNAENLHDWRGEGTTVPPRLTVPTTDPTKYPHMAWCGFMASRAWRCGCRGSVASVLIEKPTSGDFLPLADGGFSLQYAPLMEYREGKGMVLFCQLDVTGRTEADPAAQRLVSNMLSYVCTWKPGPKRTVLYAGEAAGKKHLESAGLSVTDYKGGALKADQVVVVGPGGGQTLAANGRAVQAWLKAGGHLLAVGLGQDEVNAFLPFEVTTKKTKIFASHFVPAGMKSLLAGVSPADTYNREAGDIPLVTGGATVVGDGVLAEAKGLNVVFCQLVPWRFDHVKTYNVKMTFQRSSFALTRILANMGVAGEGTLLANLETPLPARAMLEDVPNAVWLEDGESELFLPKAWKGLPLGKAEPPAGWEKAGFDDKGWRDMQVPGMWEDQFADLMDLDGLFLYRVAFDVPAEMARKEVTLVLGAVDDEDWTYLNGKFVGSLTKVTNPDDYYAAVRRYKLAKGVLKAGRNVIAVKVNDLRGAGGMKASLLKRRGVGSSRWLTGLYLDKPEWLDDPYRYYRW